LTDGSLAPQDLTELLIKWRNGDRAALDEMTPVLYEELRRLGRHFLAAERTDHTLQPTALVHEAYMRLIGQRSVDWRNRAHFLAMAATMMRRILINHAQAHKAAKRSGNAERIALDDAFGVFTDPRSISCTSMPRSTGSAASTRSRDGSSSCATSGDSRSKRRRRSSESRPPR
jgi:RNA polymerase sigma factor (TIGR02999 family)